jgi:hypothetical protein
MFVEQDGNILSGEEAMKNHSKLAKICPPHTSKMQTYNIIPTISRSVTGGGCGRPNKELQFD